MSITDLTPVLGLAPYQNSFNILGASQQNLQQFPQHVSNPPGQTVDYFFNVFSLLQNLTSYAINQTNNDPSFTSLNADLNIFLSILQSILNAVSAKYATNPRWSSPIVPYPGYAANNAVNSGANPFNVSSVNSTTAYGGQSQQNYGPFYIFFWWLSAIHQETQNSSSQVNHYTYDFLTSTTSSAVDFSATAQTYTVVQWIDVAYTNFYSNYYQSSPQWLNRNTDSSLYFLLDQVVSAITVATGEAVDRIPLFYLLAPYVTSSPFGSASEAASYKTSAPLVVFVIFSGLLYNTLTSVSPALNKISLLHDAAGNYVFEVAASKISDVLATYTTLLSNVNKYIALNPTGGDVTTTPLSIPLFYLGTTYTVKSGRTSAVDLNRIDGSLIPTLKRIKELWLLVQSLATTISASTAFGSYNGNFQSAINAVIADSNILPWILQAIASFNTQLDIHYSRWSQNLTNI